MAQECDVDVWLIALDGEGETILSPDEELRASHFRSETDRKRWTRARSALRLILADVTGVAAADIRFTVGPHGKPAIADSSGVEFSLSHSGIWAMVAVARGVPVGVDIERVRKKVDIKALLGRLGETNLPDSETALYSAWTHREATSKAAGGALFDIHQHDFRVRDLEAPDGYAAALALIGYDPKIRRRNEPNLRCPNGSPRFIGM